MSTLETQGEGLWGGLRQYGPILWIVAVVTLVSGAVALSHGLGPKQWMHGWMGGSLVIFSLFKLFDVRAFATDFAKYDLLAMRFRPYALAYPFVELALGIAFLTAFMPVLTYALTAMVFGFGLVGVVLALRQGRNLQCACVGRILNLPLSRVAVFENSTMVLMSGAMVVATVF